MITPEVFELECCTITQILDHENLILMEYHLVLARRETKAFLSAVSNQFIDLAAATFSFRKFTSLVSQNLWG